MSENKMISISFMDKVIKEVEDIVNVDYYGENLVVKKFLSFSDMVKFVNEVVAGCFDDDTGMYLPEAKTFLAQLNTVLYYSNVRLPEDVKHRYDILTKTDIVEVILSAIDINQYQSMIRSIEEKIDYRVRTNEQFFNNKLHTAMSTVETLLNNIKEYFGGITPDDMKNLMSSLVETKFDEAKLVDAYVASMAKDNASGDDTVNNESGDDE